MKKTFFQKSYNLISSLLFIGLISFILSFAFRSARTKLFGDFDIPSLNSFIIIIQNKLILLGSYTSRIATILVLVAISLIIVELTQRMISDSILNYFKSVVPDDTACDNFSDKMINQSLLSRLIIRQP